MIQEDQLLETVLKSFNKDAASWVADKEKGPKPPKDLDENFIRLFCNKEGDEMKPLITHPALEQFAKAIAGKYTSLSPSDVYFMTANILKCVYNFLLWSRSDLNVTYKSGFGHFAFQSKYVIQSKFKKPKNFSDLYKNGKLELIKDIIGETLTDADRKYKQEHFNFEFTFNSELYLDDEEINVGNRLLISVKSKTLKITGKYSGNPEVAIERLNIDLNVILSLLEMCGVILIQDAEKRVGGGRFHGGIVEDKKITFSYGSGALLKVMPMNKFEMIALEYSEHFKKFQERVSGYVPLHYFSILSEKFDEESSLRIIPQFFSSENFRFPRTEFLNYWTALEILLGNPEKDIKDSLVKAYELFYPEEKHIKTEEKTISKFWRKRNKMIHEGVIHVDPKEIWQIKNLVESVFNKILLARMTEKIFFTIHMEGQIEIKED